MLRDRDHGDLSSVLPVSVALDPFDLDAAGVRRALADLPAFTEALAVRLQQALPGRVRVERRRDGLFSRSSHVHEIAFAGEGGEYRLRLEGGAKLVATRARTVRGVVISTSEEPLAQWLGEVKGEVASLAQTLGSASDVLNAFL